MYCHNMRLNKQWYSEHWIPSENVQIHYSNELCPFFDLGISILNMVNSKLYTETYDTRKAFWFPVFKYLYDLFYYWSRIFTSDGVEYTYVYIYFLYLAFVYEE